MIKNETLQKATDKMNEALEKKNLEVRVIFNEAEGLSLSKKFEGIGIDFPTDSMESIKMRITKKLSGEKDTLKMIRSMSECTEILEIINKKWIETMALYAIIRN